MIKVQRQIELWKNNKPCMVEMKFMPLRPSLKPETMDEKRMHHELGGFLGSNFGIQMQNIIGLTSMQHKGVEESDMSIEIVMGLNDKPEMKISWLRHPSIREENWLRKEEERRRHLTTEELKREDETRDVLIRLMNDNPAIVKEWLVKRHITDVESIGV